MVKAKQKPEPASAQKPESASAQKPEPASAPKNRLNKPNRRTPAARWNLKHFQGLEAVLKRDPEADIVSKLPAKYSATLQECKNISLCPPLPNGDRSHIDVRARLKSTDPCTIPYPLSPEVYRLLSDQNDVAKSLIHLLSGSERIYRSMWEGTCAVFRVSETIVLKVTNIELATSEVQTLSYLQEHLPSFPVPRSLGLVRLGLSGLLFTTLVPGQDLEQAWPQMENYEKRDISNQLDALLQILRRKLPFPSDFQLGGVQQDGCRDARRDMRKSTEPIYTVKEFQEFIFAGAKYVSPLYIDFLRKLVPDTESGIVFTHADIRPANIMVRRGEDGGWTIAAIIDWETSGFYPDYWESVKMTNNFFQAERHDWYEYLPESVAPPQFAAHWTLDRLLDRNLVNGL